MSSNLPSAATKVGGGLRIVQNKNPSGGNDDSATAVTNVEQALGSSQQDLEHALGVVHPNPTMSVYDAAEHPKANASTYYPPLGVQNTKGPRQNAHHKHTTEIMQPGGAYGAQRH